MLWQLGAQAAWRLEATTEHMASVPENHISRLDIAMQSLLTCLKERHDLAV